MTAGAHRFGVYGSSTLLLRPGRAGTRTLRASVARERLPGMGAVVLEAWLVPAGERIRQNTGHQRRCRDPRAPGPYVSEGLFCLTSRPPGSIRQRSRRTRFPAGARSIAGDGRAVSLVEHDMGIAATDYRTIAASTSLVASSPKDRADISG